MILDNKKTPIKVFFYTGELERNWVETFSGSLEKITEKMSDWFKFEEVDLTPVSV